ncbi:MAG: molybdenum ABC transporter ATP-binding protein [Heliomarina sp.]|uniref:molybdenum ABC transporter ATP-binding protein n=1 Tax=Heliomarina sp. TaxID=2917556 RepID=UPI00405A0708
MTVSVRLSHQFSGFGLDVDFEAPAGLTVLFGRSGSGKTTIINAVAGLLKPDRGRVTIDGRDLLDTDRRIDLSTHRRQLGYIFQDARLFPHLTVAQNLSYGRWFARGPHHADEMDRTVDMLGLGPLMSRRPARLSGGERQRVAIGRALLAGPRLLLADEPLASLDEGRKAEILPYFERLRDEVDVPILYVSHAPAEVARLATTVIALENGRVVRQGPALEVLGDPMVTPAGIRAAGAVLRAEVKAHHDDGLSELDAGGIPLFLPRVPHRPGSFIRIRIAAQEVILSRERPAGLSALNILPGRVESLRAGEGPGMLVSLATPAGTILSRITRRSAMTLGLDEGVDCHAIVKSVAIAPEDVGGARPRSDG